MLLWSAGVGGSLVERHLEDLRQVRDPCMGEDSPKERLRLRLRELGLPLNGRRSDDISLRKLSEAMDISLQHENGNRKKGEELVEALITALLREVPVLGNFHESFVEKSLRDLRQVRDGLSGQAEQRGELQERLRKLKNKDPRDHVVTLTDLSRALKLPVGTSSGGLSKEKYVEQILTALLAEVPAIASVDDAKTALVDASVRELLALRDGLAGQASQRQELESRLDQFNVRGRSSDVVTLIDLCRSLGMATKQQGRYMSGGVLKRQMVEFLLRGSLDDAKKASVDTTLQELRRVRDGVEEHAARRGKLKRGLKNVGFQHQAPDVVVLQDLCRALELPIAKSDGGGLTRPELEEQIIVSLLAEVKTALVDATLQELRRVRDGVEEHACTAWQVEKVFEKRRVPAPSPWCCGVAGSLPCFRTSDRQVRWWWWQIVVSLLAEETAFGCNSSRASRVRDCGGTCARRLGQVVLCRALEDRQVRWWWSDKARIGGAAVVMLTNLSGWQWSCVGCLMDRSGMWMLLCGKCVTPFNAALVWGAVLTGTEEENLLGRHQGFEYWVEQLVRLLPGLYEYMFTQKSKSSTSYNLVM